MRIQYCISNDTNPFLNIAVEQYLLSQPEQEAVTLYLWKNRRTVVIGQNQNPYAECNVELLEREGGYLMRRRSGGGAVYHDDGNINFSFLVPKGYYDQTRQFLVLQQAVASYGLATEVSGRNDVLCHGRKFSGNAFSRGQWQNLHHGTILIKGNMEDLQRYLRVRPSKLRKHGVDSVKSRVLNLAEVAPVTSDNIVPRLLEAFGKVYGRPADGEEPAFACYADEPATALSFDTLKRQPAVQALRDAFADTEWRLGRWRNFCAQHEGQFSWGYVEVAVEVDAARGEIQRVDIATDVLSLSAVDAVKTLLVGASVYTAPPLPADWREEQCQIASDILSLLYCE